MRKIYIASIVLSIALIGILAFVSADDTQLFNDDFEDGFADWSNTGWVTDGTYQSSGAVSAMADANAGILESNGVDMSDADYFNVTFEYWVDDIDANDDIYVEFWDGAAWNEIDEIGDDAEDTQLTWFWNVTDSAYFDNGFQIRIDGTSIDNNEALWIDDVIMYKTYTVGGDSCTYTSGDWDIDCSDNCAISSPVTVDAGADIRITGTGTFSTTSDIDGFTDIIIAGTDAANRCRVICDGGCFKS
jgi:hypothetical protein